MRSAPTLKIWITPIASVAMHEKLALLNIAFCRAPVFSSASALPASSWISDGWGARGAPTNEAPAVALALARAPFDIPSIQQLRRRPRHRLCAGVHRPGERRRTGTVGYYLT